MPCGSMGRSIFRTGPLGSGHAMKALNNYVSGRVGRYSADQDPFAISSATTRPKGQSNTRGDLTMVRKGHAVWRGTGKDGTGDLTTDSGVLSSTPYSFKTRFESEPGTNPEELVAAAHAGCFTMALAFQLQGAGFTPTELATEAAVSLEK